MLEQLKICRLTLAGERKADEQLALLPDKNASFTPAREQAQAATQEGEGGKERNPRGRLQRRRRVLSPAAPGLLPPQTQPGSLRPSGLGQAPRGGFADPIPPGTGRQRSAAPGLSPPGLSPPPRAVPQAGGAEPPHRAAAAAEAAHQRSVPRGAAVTFWYLSRMSARVPPNRTVLRGGERRNSSPPSMVTAPQLGEGEAA